MTMAIATTLSSLSAAAQTPSASEPRNPDRNVLPVISGSKVTTPFGSCTVGAVLVPKSIFSRLTPYQRATRWIVLAKHCAPLHSTIHVGNVAIGTVVWQSAASDFEVVRVSPQLDQRQALHCAGHSVPASCSLIHSYIPLANNQVFMPRAGREARLAINGFSNAPEYARFCTSGYRTGVHCLWQGITLVPGMSRPSHEHIKAAESSELHNIDNGDSGGPVVTYDRHLVGIISSGAPVGRSILYYTPMQQVLHELYSYNLAPEHFPTDDEDENPLSLDGENVEWELAPTED